MTSLSSLLLSPALSGYSSLDLVTTFFKVIKGLEDAALPEALKLDCIQASAGRGEARDGRPVHSLLVRSTPQAAPPSSAGRSSRPCTCASSTASGRCCRCSPWSRASQAPRGLLGYRGQEGGLREVAAAAAAVAMQQQQEEQAPVLPALDRTTKTTWATLDCRVIEPRRRTCGVLAPPVERTSMTSNI